MFKLHESTENIEYWRANKYLVESSLPTEMQSFNPRLSSRQLEILKLITEGRSNAEIAAVLYLSPNTVKTHVRSILNKLGVDHRVQAAVVAVRHGLI